MNPAPLDKRFWENRYAHAQTGWDIGHVSTPLKSYFDQLTDKSVSILIPGAGNAHEAEYLLRQGFSQISVLDIALAPLENLKTRCPQITEERLICQDFFQHQARYDLIVEQTFFCALTPNLRPTYAKKMHELLKPNGKLVGLLFDDALNTDRPPFGGHAEEYKTYFSPYFMFHTFEKCYNSIIPRAGREVFMVLGRKGETI